VLKDAATARMLNRAAVLAAKPVRSALADPTLRNAASPRVLVPIGTWPMLALEAGLDLTDVAPFQPSAVDVAAGSPPPRKLILHLRSQDSGRRAAELAVNTRRMIGDVTLVPIVSDAQRGRWLIRLDGPP